MPYRYGIYIDYYETGMATEMNKQNTISLVLQSSPLSLLLTTVMGDAEESITLKVRGTHQDEPLAFKVC
jgi:hypothetical protein